MDDEMPSERLNALKDMTEDVHVRHSAQMLDEVEAHAPDAALVQGDVVLLSERPIDDGDPAIPTAARRDGIEHRTVVRAVAARLNDDSPLDTQDLVHRRQAIFGSVRRSVSTTWRVRESCGWPED